MFLESNQINLKIIMLVINKCLIQIIKEVIYKIIIDMLFKEEVFQLMHHLELLHNKINYNNLKQNQDHQQDMFNLTHLIYLNL